jgi:UDP-N-acetylglucosamine/UDP-N-acetylgalactosamine diphosphorylase
MKAEELLGRWSAEVELFEHWAQRPEEARQRLLADLAALDPGLLVRLRETLASAGGGAVRAPAQRGIAPLPAVPLAEWRGSREAGQAGEQLIASGRTAFLTAAGGQGTRLGWDGPKGCFRISPIRKASLFQIFAEKILAARRRYGVGFRWCIMTSPLNHDQTLEFFSEHDFFGLPAEEVILFRQGLLPSLTPEGRLLLAADGGLAQNPTGHGGILQAMRSEGVTWRLLVAGVEELFYFQVDNPLVRLPDPQFAGWHRLRGSQMSSKVIPKDHPEERLGVPGLLAGRPVVIEYSDLDPQQMRGRAPGGGLRFPQGSIAIHLLNTAFAARVPLPLPLHLARKRVRCLVPRPGGAAVEEREAVKFESFIFDAVPLAAAPQFLETSREEEFAPLKNATGPDSIATCTAGLIDQHSRWLEACGVQVPREGGRPKYRVEISPLFAADPQTLQERLGHTVNRIDEDTLFA